MKRFALALLIGVIGSSSRHEAVSADSLPLDDTDVYAFLWELNAADRRCDAEWLEAHYVSDVKLTFQVKGQAPETIGRDEYFKTYRAECFHTQRSFDRNCISVEVNPSRAVVRGRWEGATITRFFFLDPYQFESIEETMSLIRVGEEIGVAEIHQVAVPVADHEGAGSKRRNR